MRRRIQLRTVVLNLIDVLNPTSSIHAFIKPKGQAMWRDQLQPMMAKQSVTSRIIPNHSSGVNQTAEPLKLTHRTQVKNHWLRVSLVIDRMFLMWELY